MTFARTFSLVLLSFVFLSSASFGASSVNKCLSFYEPSSKELIALIDSIQKNSKSNTEWLAFPMSDRATQNMVEKLIELSLGKKAAFAESIKLKRFKDSGLQTIALLALHDEVTWFKYLDKAMKAPLLDDSLVNSLIPIVRSMPENLKSKVISKVTANYSSLSKINHTNFPRRRNLRLAPKRSIDAVLLHLIKPDVWLRQDVQKTKDPVQSYVNYLNYLKSDIFPASDRGNYSVDVIMTVAETIQSQMKALASDIASPSVTITGSFPNGRAKLSDTDLDCQVSHRDLIKHFPAFTAAINEKMAKAFAFSSKFQVDAMWESTTPHFAAQINPIFLKITPTHIQIEVFSAVQPFHKDSILLPQNYQAPDVYVLKEASEKTNVVSLPRKESVVPTYMTAQIELAKKLETYQEHDWIEFVRSISKAPQFNDFVQNSLVPVIKNMPDSLRKKVLDEIEIQYPKAHDKNWVRKGWFFQIKKMALLSPQQSLDILTNQLLPARKFIEKMIEGGKKVDKAYESYLAELRSGVYSRAKVGHYTGAEVNGIVLGIRGFLQSSDLIPKGTAIRLVGRFPNGRAYVSPIPVELIVPDFVHDLDLNKIRAGIARRINQHDPKLKFEVSVLSQNITETKVAVTDPIQIQITHDDVNLLIYDPIKTIDRDQILLPQNYEAPISLKLYKEFAIAQ